MIEKIFKIVFRIIIILIFMMIIWFCFEMMYLESQQKKINELQEQKEIYDQQYNELMKEVEEELNDGNIL